MRESDGYEFKPARFWRFVGLCIQDAWDESLSKADAITSAGGAAIGIVLHFMPSWEARVTPSLWAIPVVAAVGVLVARLAMSPYRVYRAHKDSLLEELQNKESRIRELSEKLEPRLKLLPVVHEQPIGFRTTYFIDVVNASKGRTVFGVKVEVVDINPKFDGWNIPLHIKHDNPTTQGHKKEFSLNPGDTQSIDLVTGGGREFFQIVDVIGDADGGRNWTKVFWKDVPSGVCTLLVRATGNDSPDTEARFYVTVDNNFKLRCESSMQQLAPYIPDAPLSGA
jgi:hypothetical protein